jgi:hypothetical protein
MAVFNSSLMRVLSAESMFLFVARNHVAGNGDILTEIIFG